MAELVDWIDLHPDLLGTLLLSMLLEGDTISNFFALFLCRPSAHVPAARPKDPCGGHVRCKGRSECVPEVQKQNGAPLPPAASGMSCCLLP